MNSIIAYHGSNNNFSEFKKDNNSFIWFSDSKEYCLSYADGKAAFLYTAEITWNNALDLTNCILAEHAFLHGLPSKDLLALTLDLQMTIDAMLAFIHDNIHYPLSDIYLFDIVKHPVFISDYIEDDIDCLVCQDYTWDEQIVTTYGIREENQIEVLEIEEVENDDDDFTLDEAIQIAEKDIQKPANGNIYIVGFQASGKSTLAKKLAAKFNFKLVSLDDFDTYERKDFYKQWADENYTDGDFYEQFITWSADKSGYVIEGVQLWDLVDLIDLKKHIFILVDKNKDTILKQGWDRDSLDDVYINGRKITSKDDYDNTVSQEFDEVSKLFIEPLKNKDNVYILTESTRNQLIGASRNADPYKDKHRGKNRFERKKYSKIANQVKSYNQINMNDFFKKDTLEINIPVIGETNDYTVSIQMEGIVTEIAKNIKANSNKLEFRTIIQSLTKIFNSANIKVKCTCPDYSFHYDHWLITSGDSINDTAHDPGPGTKGLDPKGKGCKHILLVLSNQDFLMKVASVIHNYINYMQEHKQQAFLKIMFPKLYGIPADAAEEADLVPEDTELETEKHIIDLINDYGKNRGRYKKGSNKNPITGTGGKSKKETTISKKDLEHKG